MRVLVQDSEIDDDRVFENVLGLVSENVEEIPSVEVVYDGEIERVVEELVDPNSLVSVLVFDKVEESDPLGEATASSVCEIVTDFELLKEVVLENVSVRELVPVTRPVNVFDCVSVAVLEAKIE